MHTSTVSVIRRSAAALVASLVLLASFASPAQAQERDGDDQRAYQQAIDNAEAIVWDDEVIELAARHGLDVVNVAWEDTGRYDNSSVGPNISDVTIQVARPLEGTDDHALALMPVIRYPNFSDKTGDIALDKFYLPVGNEDGEGLDVVTLEHYLGNIGQHLSDRGRGNEDLSLLAERDSHVLVSAQAAFLPVPQQGIAEFNPVIFNYQSYEGNPAVLTIVVTAEGTSATIIDNQRDGFSSGGTWGQRLFFNQNGERASLTGERVSDASAPDAAGLFDAKDPFAAGADAPAAGAVNDSNVVMIIQVPLKHEAFEFYAYESEESCEDCDYSLEAVDTASDVEDAVIGHGEVEGPFTELDGLAIERDPDFPIRVTVQFYKATATGAVSAADVEAIAADITRVYEEADYVGSLVTDGPSGRPTEYDGEHIQPNGWWQEVVVRHGGLFDS